MSWLKKIYEKAKRPGKWIEIPLPKSLKKKEETEEERKKEEE